MPGQEHFDPHAILASLGITDVGAIQPVTGGMDTAIWRVTWNGQPYALRLMRPQQAATYEREVAAMQAAAAGGVVVPELVRYSLWEGRPVMLLSWLRGGTLASELLRQPYRIWQLGTAFGGMQAVIHRIPAPPALNPTEWIEWAGDEPELKARLYDLPSRQTRLIHLDYHPLNVMADAGRITGVIDWTNARAGDPRADFARTYSILRVEPYSAEGDDLKLAFFRRSLAACWRIGYQRAGGSLDDMALFYAWAGAAMIRDLSPRIGKPDFWLQSHHLDGIRAWRDVWKKKAGIKV
ncbi:MAG: aminoglycoside phosphotransferase family protein [Chloroflexi bacterium]|nr:aminoglycoside phosphotransferase family protein [Chloroflexota bacterium]MCC6892758.1 aminoglycoside phosphotransferase family protein [Anaerolineae bacterium]